MNRICQREDARISRTALSLLPALFLLILSTCALGAQAQLPLKSGPRAAPQEAAPSEVAKPQPVPKVLGPPDDYDRGVPRTSVMGFLAAARQGDYERASQYLDQRNLPSWMRDLTGPELARQLKMVLDRFLWIDPELLSDDPAGYPDDGLPPSRDLLGQIETDVKKYTLLLQRVPGEDGVFIWKISNATVAQIPELYAQVGYNRFGEYLSGKLPEVEILGAMLWQWAGLLVLMVLAFLAVLLPTWLVAFFLLRRGTDKEVQVARFIRGPLRLLLWVLLVRSFIDLVNPTVTMQAVVRAETLLIIAVAWTVIRLSDFYLDYKSSEFARTGRRGAVVALHGPLKIIARVAIAIIAVLVWLDNLGFSVATLIAGLGVGGIAIALAAQRTFEDMIGAAVLFLSQPVRIGDFGRFGTTLGTVEEIGLRGTRIRTLENTVITVSNSDLSRMPIENFSARERIWYHPRISLPYDTGRKIVRTIIDRIGSFLRTDPRVDADSARIRFVEIGSYALVLDVFAYVKETDYARYLAVAEELNFAIMEIIEEAGGRLALPSQRLQFDSSRDRPDASAGAQGSTVDERG